tara:strand:- start:211 stop:453 length:243 start_codon:yes stop_codon:yes gene_type:complete
MTKGIRGFFDKAFSGNLSASGKILLSISIIWMLVIGYLTWWNGIKNPGMDKSFKWDEWFWFGVIPAIGPYLLYFIWKNKE